MKTFDLSLIAILFFFNPSHTHAQSFVWAKNFESTGASFGTTITTDEVGNIYTTGRFKNTTDFDPGEGVFNLSSSGSTDVFISKLDNNGAFIWAKKVGGTRIDSGHDIKTDQVGNVYVTGYFWDTVDFDPGDEVYNLTAMQGANSSPDFFILKLDSNGDFLWAHSFGGVAWDLANAVTIDEDGNVLIVGYFKGTVDFDPSSAIHDLNSGSSESGFALKLNTTGGLVWAKSISGSSNVVVDAIAIDHESDIYLTGYFNGTADFDPGDEVFSVTSLGVRDVFICKLTPDGDFIWMERVGGDGDDHGLSLAFDSNNNVYTIGNFRGGNVDFDSSANFALLDSQGQNDVFILKLDENGGFLWVKAMGGPDFEIGTSVLIDGEDNIYSFGYFRGTVDFDPGIDVSNLETAGMDDIFLQKLDSNGDFIWAKRIGSDLTDKCRGAAIDASGSLYLTGEYTGTVDFDPDEGVSNLSTGNNNSKIFIMKLSCSSSYSMDVSACENYLSPSGNHTWTTTGIYLDTIPNTSGCDSVITINLMANETITTITQNGADLFANAVDTEYQWLDCENDFSIINDEISQTFTALGDGNYAVQLTQNGCVDTSACIMVQIVGTIENELDEKLLLYPNPLKERITIDLGETYPNISVNIINIDGRIVKTEEFINTAIIHMKIEGASGYYLIEMIIGDKIRRIRVVKE